MQGASLWGSWLGEEGSMAIEGGQHHRYGRGCCGAGEGQGAVGWVSNSYLRVRPGATQQVFEGLHALLAVAELYSLTGISKGERAIF